MTIEAWTSFFGWCTVVNIGIYLITVIALAAMRSFAYRVNAKIFRIGEEDVARITFQYVGAYKLAITVFCFAPWLALKIMAGA
jgi:hypothetical protein